MKNVLFLGAHYDDIEIGVGGVLMKHIDAGHKVTICVLCADEFRTGDPTVRLKEQMNVLKYLRLSDDSLVCFNTTTEDTDVIKKLDPIKPDILYIPYEDDSHQDHRRCSVIGQSVGRKPYITTLYYGGASVRNFLPNVFVSVDAGRKEFLLNFFVSQIECGAINIDRVKKRERYWGTMISSKADSYAEGFVVYKMEIKINEKTTWF